jgi:DNA-binding Lrp family transcriptional regulator
MLAIERRSAILSKLVVEGKVLVSDLSQEFGVTEETIRRDLEKLDNDIKLLYNKEEEKVRAAIAELQQKLYDEMGVKQELFAQLSKEVEQMKITRDSLNEDILRRKELEEHEEYYRVVVSEFAKADINLLMDVRDKLHIRESLDKLIYETYVSKAVTEMTRRVLSGEAPSGIYKITRLKTGEIYIGKSTDVKKRWTEHCKTAFGVGSIAHSILHTTMKKDGIDNFTFELLEKVPKDKLTEREKYWIAFYDTKKYGMNERNG